MQSTLKSVETANQLLCLWAHECLRVFADRLVDATDVGWFYAQLEGQLKDRFKKSWVDVVGTEDKRLLFGDFGFVRCHGLFDLLDSPLPSGQTPLF